MLNWESNARFVVAAAKRVRHPVAGLIAPEYSAFAVDGARAGPISAG
jgi:hypothetical protein